MSAPEEGKSHRETRHSEDKPSKRRHPHGKRHQADADSRLITEADLDSEASSLQDDDDLVESLSRSSSRRTASSRNQPAQLAPAGLPAVGPPCPDSGSPAFPSAGPLRSQPPSHGGRCSQNHGTSLLDKWYFNVGGLNVSPSRSSSSSRARSCNASGHLDHHSWTDCLPCS